MLWVVEFCRIMELLRLEKALRRSLPTWCRRTPRLVSFQPTSCPGILMLFPDFLGVDLAFAVLFLPSPQPPVTAIPASCWLSPLLPSLNPTNLQLSHSHWKLPPHSCLSSPRGQRGIRNPISTTLCIRFMGAGAPLEHREMPIIVCFKL